MKKKYVPFALLAFFSLSLIDAGCLKDKNYDNGSIQSLHPTGDQKIIELRVNAISAQNYSSISLNASTQDTVLDVIPVNLASAEPASQDIHVTLAQDNALIDSVNASTGNSYTAPPAGSYTIVNPGNVVTIPKGQHTGYLMAKFAPADFASGSYAFAYKIQSVQEPGYTISGNLSTGVFGVNIKNKYDGIYTIDASSSLVDHVAPANNSVPGDPYPFNVELVTTGANSVAMYISGLGYGHLIAGGAYYGEFSPVFTFDGSGNIISVTNYYGQPSPTRLRAAQLDPTGANKQNADKSIDVKYIMTQGGAPRTYFSEHLVYKGPR